MKIKHWQGYGTVNAKKISDKNGCLVIEVWGNHEWGIMLEDRYDVYNWLIKKFKKEIPSYTDIHIEHIENEYKPMDMNGELVECATYYIAYDL